MLSHNMIFLFNVHSILSEVRIAGFICASSFETAEGTERD